MYGICITILKKVYLSQCDNFCQSDFMWNQFWRICTSFGHFRGSEFCCWFGTVLACKKCKIHKNQNSELVIMFKWQMYHFISTQNWFHVKYEWLKNYEISTLCIFGHWKKFSLTKCMTTGIERQKAFGLKSVPRATMTPWSIILRTGGGLSLRM